MEGRVLETNWRATQILTVANDLAIVLNNVIAKSKLVNASRPTGAHGLTVIVRLDSSVAPAAGVAVLATALLSCNLILRTPAATVTVKSLDALAIECELQIFVATIEQGPEAQNEVYDFVFRHCLSSGIRIAPPAGSATMLTARGPPRRSPTCPSGFSSDCRFSRRCLTKSDCRSHRK